MEGNVDVENVSSVHALIHHVLVNTIPRNRWITAAVRNLEAFDHAFEDTAVVCGGMRWLRGVVWCGVVLCGAVRCGVVVWCGAVWCGVLQCGAVWCGAVWCVVLWCDVV